MPRRTSNTLETDFEKIALALSRALVASGKSGTAPLAERRVSISIQVDGVEMAVATGNHTGAVPSMALRAAPESCREVFSLQSSDFSLKQRLPDVAEEAACGKIKKKISRADAEFKTLVKNMNPDIVFKDEELTGADRMMSRKMQIGVDALAVKVKAEWPGVMLRITEAWDETGEHAGASLHYEGRAADLTTQPVDPSKYGRLARLAADTGFDWVFYEDTGHVHVSVKA